MKNRSMFVQLAAERELNIVHKILKSLSNEANRQGASVNQSHHVDSSLSATSAQVVIHIIHTEGPKGQDRGERIFHLGPNVVQAMGEFDGVLLLVLIEHLELNVRLFCFFELLERVR